MHNNTDYHSNSLMILVDTKSIIKGKAKFFTFSPASAAAAATPGVVPGPLGTKTETRIDLSDKGIQDSLETTKQIGSTTGTGGY